MKSILLIIPYFGKWPIWFDAHLCSIDSNPTINWFCPTDCEIPIKHPKNIKFLPTNLSELSRHVSEIVNVEVPLSPRKFCDLKPAYGAIFNEEIKEYDFWGFCDMDIIWGDIRNFMSPYLLDNYDIISSRVGAISGHFNLFRNKKSLTHFYKDVPNYKELFRCEKYMWFEEDILTNYLMLLTEHEKNPYKIYWNNELLKKGIESEVHQEYYLDRWLFIDGKILDLYSKEHKEYMYLHFINWKQTMRICEINYDDFPTQFYISYNGIHYYKHSKVTHLMNFIKNMFNGYYVKSRKRTIKFKIKSYVKRFKLKISFMI